MEKKTTTTTTVAIQNHFNNTFAKWMVAIFEVPRNTSIQVYLQFQIVNQINKKMFLIVNFIFKLGFSFTLSSSSFSKNDWLTVGRTASVLLIVGDGVVVVCEPLLKTGLNLNKIRYELTWEFIYLTVKWLVTILIKEMVTN